MKKYDGLYIFAGLAKDDNVDALLEKVTGEITRLQGTILSADVLGKRTFARPMQKKENGIYARVRFEMKPDKVNALRDRYRLAEEVFRVQIQAVHERREAVLSEQAAKFKAREAARQAAADQVAAEQAAAAEEQAAAEQEA